MISYFILHTLTIKDYKMHISNEEKQLFIAAVMQASTDALKERFGEDVGFIMLVKEQDSPDTHAMTNLDPEDASQIALGFIEHSPSAKKVVV